MKTIILIALLIFPCITYADKIGRQQTDDIQVSSSISDEQLKILKHDINFLMTYIDPKKQVKFLNIITETNKVTSEVLFKWLHTRIKILIHGSQLEDKKISFVVVNENAVATNPTLPFNEQIPSEDQQTKLHSHEKESKLMAFNLGTLVYQTGKLSNIILGIKINNTVYPANSPRVGVIILNEDFFNNNPFPQDVAWDSRIRTIYRIALLFHEARHSDGNGETLGFMHAVCPTKDLSCDRNINGPNMIAAAITKFLSENCTNCTTNEKDNLEKLIALFLSKIIISTPLSELEGPEHLNFMCRRIAFHNNQILTAPVFGIPRSCNTEIDENENIPSVIWDDKPEYLQKSRR
ncbi:MAG: hypothetical protein QXL17_02825 [Candidatus Thermoplasmatota archaeon]